MKQEYKYVDPHFVKDTHLHHAIRENRYGDVLQLLNKPNIKLNQQIYSGDTALLYSLKLGRSNRLISSLIVRGCDVNIKNRREESPLHYSVQQVDDDITHKLILSGADINAKDCNGSTPLHIAVGKRKERNIHCLLYFGAYANEINCNGLTPCTMTFYKPYSELSSISTYLSNYAVKFNTTDLHYALKQRSPLVLNIIESGTKVNVLVGDWRILHQQHIINLSLLYTKCNVFLAMAERVKLKLLLNLGYRDEDCFLGTFFKTCRFETKDYLKCLYLIFEPPEIKEFVEQYLNKKESKGQGMYHIFENHTLSLDDRLKIIYLFLSYGFEISFRDVSALYNKYVHSHPYLDESVELLLNHGTWIHEFTSCFTYLHLTICRMCYDNFEMYSDRLYEWLTIYASEIRRYKTLYKADFEMSTRKFNNSYYIFVNTRKGKPIRFYEVTEVPSLVQLSRDAFRTAAYKMCNRRGTFKVYQLISTLPVPTLVKDILKLKVPIYEVGS